MNAADERFDVIVAGGGLAGMTAASAFAALGLRVACIDPRPPVTEGDAQGADHRSTALLAPSRDLLAELGVWQRLESDATPLAVMRIHDRDDDPGPPALSRDFTAAEIGSAPFGWNLPNWRIRQALADHLAELQGQGIAAHLTGRAVTSVTTRSREALVDLDDGGRLTARLLLAADGRGSPVRRALGIGTRTLRYGQKALAFAVTHPIPHDNVSIEIYRSGGPFTLVPLPDRDGSPASAVVWMQRAAEAERHLAMGDADFDAAISRRSGHVLGPLAHTTPRNAWPITTQIARSFTAERTALIAEAAHVMPPIGAQGLNTSLSDIRCLRDLAARAPEGLGGPEMLAAYSRARRADVLARAAAVDVLNRVTLSGAAPIRALRRRALAALHAPKPLRQALMRAGLGGAA